MFILKYLLEHGGVKRVDAFIHKFYDLYDNLSDAKQKKFIESYLKHDFDSTNPFKFAILHYVKEICDGKEQMDKLLLDSNYFRTMPNEFVSDTINAVLVNNLEDELKDFFQSLFPRISEIRELFKVPLALVNYNINTLIDSILAFKNISLIIIKLYDLNSRQRLELFQKMGDYFTIPELKDFCKRDNELDVDYLGTIFAKALRDQQSEVIDAILEVVLEKQKSKAFVTKMKGKDKKDFKFFVNFVKKTSDPYYFYKAFARHVEEDEHFSLEDKEAIALKIKDLNDVYLMYSWVIYTKCEVNHILIDELLNREEISLLPLFFSLSEEDLMPVLAKFSKFDKKRIDSFITELACSVNKDNIDRVDCILTALLNPRVSISREDCICFMGAGSRYFGYFINLFSFTDEERKEILNRLEMNQLYDFIAVYGAYLLSGDPSKLLDGDTISNSFGFNRERKDVKNQ